MNEYALVLPEKAKKSLSLGGGLHGGWSVNNGLYTKLFNN
jgi:hypothetical protein